VGRSYGVRYSRADLVLSQRDMRLIDYDSVASAVADPDFPLEGTGDTALLLAKRGEMFDLNVVAACIWEAIDGERTVLEIAAGLCTLFEVSLEEACGHTLKLLRELESMGLVECDAPASDEEMGIATGRSST
jgi:hypothetical protein